MKRKLEANKERSSEKRTYLLFRLAKRMFCVPIDSVLQVIRNTNLSLAPKARDYIEGVVNFRGQILTVVNMFKKLSLPNTDNSLGDIIVSEIDHKGKLVQIGSLVEQVLGVVEFPKKQILSQPDLGSTYNSEFVKGVIKHKDDFVYILNTDKIFAESDIIKLITN